MNQTTFTCVGADALLCQWIYSSFKQLKKGDSHASEEQENLPNPFGCS
jgi:hypothetical protein